MTSQDLLADRPAHQGHRRRLRWVLPALFLVLVLAVLGRSVLQEDERPSVPLGAVTEVPGGLVRVNGVLPDEQPGAPGGPVPADLAGPLPAGLHRMRVLLELTALEPGGVEFVTQDWSVRRLGQRTSSPLWASTPEGTLEQGESLQVALVFEVPDKAVELVLEGDGARLALGTGHHAGGSA